MRKRASALIIKDKRLLLVSDNGTWYWTPGGRPEEGETYVEALVRELEEELGVQTSQFEHLITYNFEPEETANFISEKGEESCFLVQIEGEPSVAAEINIMRWVTADEALRLPMLQSVKDNVIKLLINKGLL